MNKYPLMPELGELRRNWAWFLVLGIALIVLGVFSLGAVWLSTIASALMFGWLLIFGGTFELIASFSAGRWSGLLLNMFLGVLYVVGGALIVGHPVASAVGLTLVMAALFLTGGLIRLISAATLRYHSWGWAFLDGVVTALLGVLIWRAWPSSSLWVLGTFLGVALLFRGWSWVIFSLGAHELPSYPLESGTVDERIRPAA